MYLPFPTKSASLYSIYTDLKNMTGIHSNISGATVSDSTLQSVGKHVIFKIFSHSAPRAKNFSHMIPPSVNFLLSFRFIASFAFVLQRLRAKPIPLCRAGGYSRRLFDSRHSLRRDASIFRFAQCQVCFANIAPALRCDSIITQIGRENNISAEICWCTCRGGVSPPVLSLKIGCSLEGRPLPYD